LEKKVDTRKILMDRLQQQLKQQMAELLTSQQEGDALRKLVNNKMEMCNTQYESLQGQLKEHSSDIQVSMEKLVEAHKELSGVF
jgi:uncharacterized protein YjgD (DUF1641 family)